METKKPKATKNYIVRIWSQKHYGEKANIYSNVFRGTITSVKTKKVVHFHNAAEFLSRIDKLYRAEEKK